MRKLKRAGAKETTSDETTPVTTKTVAKDGGLEEILKKIDEIGTLENSILALLTTDFSGSGKSPATLNSTTLSRLDNDQHVFLGRQQKAGTKQGEKPLLIPDFVNLGTYAISEEEQEIGNNSSRGKTVLRAGKGKPKLEQMTLSMWVAPNSRIMHELLKKGKLSATTFDIAKYLEYTVKFAELLESHSLGCVR